MPKIVGVVDRSRRETGVAAKPPGGGHAMYNAWPAELLHSAEPGNHLSDNDLMVGQKRFERYVDVIQGHEGGVLAGAMDINVHRGVVVLMGD